MTNAPITPGTQPTHVSSATIATEPQPLSITASGGNTIANRTLQNDIVIIIYSIVYNVIFSVLLY